MFRIGLPGGNMVPGLDVLYCHRDLQSPACGLRRGGQRNRLAHERFIVDAKQGVGGERCGVA